MNDFRYYDLEDIDSCSNFQQLLIKSGVISLLDPEPEMERGGINNPQQMANQNGINYYGEAGPSHANFCNPISENPEQNNVGNQEDNPGVYDNTPLLFHNTRQWNGNNIPRQPNPRRVELKMAQGEYSFYSAMRDELDKLKHHVARENRRLMDEIDNVVRHAQTFRTNIMYIHNNLEKVRTFVKTSYKKEAFTTNINTFAFRNSPVPTFYGCPMEDPEIFIKAMNNYFHFANVEKDEEKVWMSTSQFQDKALIWWRGMENPSINWQQLCTMLIQQYNTDNVLLWNVEEFENAKQGEKPAQLFILEQIRIVGRLSKYGNEVMYVNVIKQQLNAPLPAYLSKIKIENFSQLIKFANQAELLFALKEKRHLPTEINPEELDLNIFGQVVAKCQFCNRTDYYYPHFNFYYYFEYYYFCISNFQLFISFRM